MSWSLNQVSLIGHVGADPEIRTTEGGRKVANLRLATNESWTDKRSGEKREQTEWHHIVVWSEGLIDVLEKYVSKGDRLYLSGKLQTRKWEDRDGNERYTTEIVLTGFDAKLGMLGSRQGGDAGAASEGTPAAGNGQPAHNLDDEIPF